MMSFKDPIIILLLLGGIFLLFPKECSSSLLGLEGSINSESVTDLRTADKNILEGYTDVTNYEDEFIAVGSNGRIDRISKSGEVIERLNFYGIRFTSVLSVDAQIFVAGDNGNMLVSSGKGEFLKIDCGTDKNINSLTWFGNKIIAGTNQGEILIGTDAGKFKSIQLNLKGNIVSLSANTTDCYGVTDMGEIIHTIEGMNWSVFDFNKTYEGFYKASQFTKVLVTENQISIIGIQNDGLPVLFYSSRGTVWTQRNLVYTDEGGVSSVLTDIPNDIYYDVTQDQFILICNHGKAMTIPNCSHCNKLFELSSENLLGIAGDENSLIVVGENDYIKLTYTK